MPTTSESAPVRTPGAGERFGGCLLFAFLALGALIIPLVGWVASPVLLFLALGSLFQGSYHQGKCPYCGHENKVSEGRPGADCAACKRRFVVRDGQYWSA